MCVALLSKAKSVSLYWKLFPEKAIYHGYPFSLSLSWVASCEATTIPFCIGFVCEVEASSNLADRLHATALETSDCSQPQVFIPNFLSLSYMHVVTLQDTHMFARVCALACGAAFKAATPLTLSPL